MKIIKDKTGPPTNIRDIHLHVESVDNHTQVDQFCHHLETINNLKITSFSWSEKKGFIISVSLTAPMPLVDRLVQTYLVKEVSNKKNDFTVVLNNTSMEEKPQALALSEERILAQ